MRELLFRLIFIAIRGLRASGKRRLRPLTSGDTVLYLQFERPLGCCVHGTPLVAALRAIAPGVRVIAATRGPGAATLRHDPAIDHLIETGADPVGSITALWRAAAEIRQQLKAIAARPDAIVQDASNRRGSSALLAAVLRLAPTIGFGDTPALYDVHLPYDPGLSLIDNNLRIATALGGTPDHREPAVYFSPGELARVRSLLGQVSTNARGLIGFVLQGSGGQPTSWHDERFAEVVRALEVEGYATVFLGTQADVAPIDAVRKIAASTGLSLAGKTSISEAAALLCLCDLLIAVDTGTMHLGRSAGVPMVVLGPSWQRPLEWLPVEVETVRILRGPDRNDVPPHYHLDEITVPEVLAAARELLDRYPLSESSREERVAQRLSEVRP